MLDEINRKGDSLNLMNKVECAWKRLDDIKETAEQHMFPKLLYIDLTMKPLYEDLQKNWDDHHAEIFLMGMDKMFQLLGCKNMVEWEEILKKRKKVKCNL